MISGFLFEMAPLAAEIFFSTIDFGLRDLSRSNQRRNACVRQFVAVLAHAVFQASGFESPLMAKFPIIVRAVLYVFVTGLRRADAANNECNGDKQCRAIACHLRILPFRSSPDCRVRAQVLCGPG